MDKKILNTISEQCVCLIETSFVDDLGNYSKGRGTAFWVFHNSKFLLVTNRHNIDITIFKPLEKPKKLSEFRILIRQNANSGQTTSGFQWIDIKPSDISIFLHQEADVAILDIQNIPLIIKRTGLRSEDIADENYFKEEASFLDPIFFIGYPMDWYNTIQMLPIARIAHIANNPSMPFSNAFLKASQKIILVTGLSFSGNSGSVVIFPGTGIKEITTTNFPYRGPKCLGIMSGHLKEKGSEHSGLSYFTRSSAIHDILHEISGA